MTRDATQFPAQPSRRAVLRAGVAGLAALPVATLAGCTSAPAPKPPDPLVPLAAKARQDAADAKAIAGKVPGLAGPATLVAKARTEHAVALQAEVDRENPPGSGTPSPPAPKPATPPGSAASATQRLDGALAAAQKQATALVVSVPRYRAGLLGSVAAGCASLREVLG